MQHSPLYISEMSTGIRQKLYYSATRKEEANDTVGLEASRCVRTGRQGKTDTGPPHSSVESEAA